MQPETYTHDYTAIEQRLKQLDAPAFRQRLIGRSVLILAGAVAMCALLLSAGYAWQLATGPRQIETIVERPVSEPEAPRLPDIPESAETDGGVVTTNFTLFRETEQDVDGLSFNVSAGHTFDNEADTTFSSAWCYTYVLVDTVEIRINLGSKEPGKAAILQQISSRTLEQAGLTPEDHTRLFESCPWLSGNPNI